MPRERRGRRTRRAASSAGVSTGDKVFRCDHARGWAGRFRDHRDDLDVPAAHGRGAHSGTPGSRSSPPAVQRQHERLRHRRAAAGRCDHRRDRTRHRRTGRGGHRAVHLRVRANLAAPPLGHGDRPDGRHSQHHLRAVGVRFPDGPDGRLRTAGWRGTSASSRSSRSTLPSSLPATLHGRALHRRRGGLAHGDPIVTSLCPGDLLAGAAGRAGGRLRARRDPLGDGPHGGAAVRPVRGHRGEHARHGPRPRRRHRHLVPDHADPHASARTSCKAAGTASRYAIILDIFNGPKCCPP